VPPGLMPLRSHCPGHGGHSGRADDPLRDGRVVDARGEQGVKCPAVTHMG